MSFATWMDQQKRAQENGGVKEEEMGFLGGLTGVGDSLTAQMQELSGALPDANSVTGVEFRRRMQHSIYLLLSSIGFMALAILVGLPTLVLKPSKFVICVTLSTLSAFSSVVVLQKPSVFLSNLWEGGLDKAKPILALLLSIVLTLYTVTVTRKYVVVVCVGGLQVLAIVYYLSSFIPGGSTGLSVLLRSSYAVLYACLTPCRLYAKSFVTQVFSSD